MMFLLVSAEHFERNQEGDDAGAGRWIEDEQYNDGKNEDNQYHLGSRRKLFELFDTLFEAHDLPSSVS